MPELDVGAEQFSDEDRLYSGSRFQDVVDAVFANPYQAVWGRDGEPALPDEQVTIRTVFGGLLSLGKRSRFHSASERALDSGADLRWGPDRRGFKRLLPAPDVPELAPDRDDGLRQRGHLVQRRLRHSLHTSDVAQRSQRSGHGDARQ